MTVAFLRAGGSTERRRGRHYEAKSPFL